MYRRSGCATGTIRTLVVWRFTATIWPYRATSIKPQRSVVARCVLPARSSICTVVGSVAQFAVSAPRPVGATTSCSNGHKRRASSAEEQGFEYVQALATMLEASARVSLGEDAESAQLWRCAALPPGKRRALFSLVRAFCCSLAECAVATGDDKAAAQRLTEALADSERLGEGLPRPRGPSPDRGARLAAWRSASG